MAMIIVGLPGYDFVCEVVGLCRPTIIPDAARNPHDSVVRVASVLPASKAENLMGQVTVGSGASPAGLAFDSNGQIVGHSDGVDSQRDESAEYVDVVVHQEDMAPGKQPSYLQIIPDEPSCISYIATRLADGRPGIWSGDAGRVCGKEWYYSNGPSDAPLPACTWVGAAMQFEMIADLDPKQLCGENLLSLKAKSPFDTNRSTSRKKRSKTLDLPSSAFGHLVVSHRDHHSAKELCESDSSRGPDMVSLSDLTYCNMDTKEHYPLCGEDQKSECMDMKTLSFVTTKRSVAVKDYAGLVRWGEATNGCPPQYPTCGETCPREYKMCQPGCGMIYCPVANPP